MIDERKGAAQGEIGKVEEKKKKYNPSLQRNKCNGIKTVSHGGRHLKVSLPPSHSPPNWALSNALVPNINYANWENLYPAKLHIFPHT